MIESVDTITCVEVVLSSDNFPNIFYRYGPDSWMEQYGMSTESVYDCEDLERQYQQFIK